MLEKPALENERIVACLRNVFGLAVETIRFLPLGADANTAVYQTTTYNQTPYFVKLRRGDFDPAAVAVPKFLSDAGIKQIIPSLPTKTGQLWANLDDYKVILYPFIQGHNGFQLNLSDQQRIEFGTAMKQFHTANVPAALTNTLPREDFSPKWREGVKSILRRIDAEQFKDPLAAELAIFLRTKRAEILELIKRAEQLAQKLKTRLPEFILCHADIHGWNLLIEEDGTLYMVDWDTLIFAPKERDLMFVGCGLGGNGHTLEEEERLFYQGYGQTDRNETALAYYRYERIIVDIFEFCTHILGSDDEGEDRKWALATLKTQFRPNNTIDLARQLDKTSL